MTKKLITTLSIVLLLGSTPIIGVSANSNIDIRELNLPQPFTAKIGESYEEAKDPFLRKGTENVEESQISFFVIPAVVVGIILLFLFFNRE